MEKRISLHHRAPQTLRGVNSFVLQTNDPIPLTFDLAFLKSEMKFCNPLA